MTGPPPRVKRLPLGNCPSALPEGAQRPGPRQWESTQWTALSLRLRQGEKIEPPRWRAAQILWWKQRMPAALRWMLPPRTPRGAKVLHLPSKPLPPPLQRRGPSIPTGSRHQSFCSAPHLFDVAEGPASQDSGQRTWALPLWQKGSWTFPKPSGSLRCHRSGRERSRTRRTSRTG